MLQPGGCKRVKRRGAYVLVRACVVFMCRQGATGARATRSAGTKRAAGTPSRFGGAQRGARACAGSNALGSKATTAQPPRRKARARAR